MKVTGAQALFKSLEGEGVDIVFGIPGGAILPAYDPLLDSSVRHVLCRHEQGAGHAAEGYAWATGKVGVAMATSGPGGCNLVTALADAKMDSVPMVAITGQVPTPVVGNDAFQEADITGITMPVTKHNMLVTDPGEVAEAIREAFHIARTGRPGPVLVDLPKDVLVNETTWKWPDGVTLPGYKPTTKGNVRQIAEAAKLIMKAKRPVLYVGGGVIKADASKELYKLATSGQLPVVTTLMARGAFPDSHELCLGMPGMHGNYTAVTAMQKADLLVALGARFDDRVTGKLDAFAPDATVIHVDIDPAEIGKNRVVEVPIVGDCKDVIGKLAHEIGKRQDEAGGVPDRTAWLGQLEAWKQEFPYAYDQQPDGPLEAAVLHRTAARRGGRGRDRRLGGRTASDVGVTVLALREAAPVDQLRGPGHDGLRGAGGARRCRRHAGQARDRDRRGRLLPDDGPGARHVDHGEHPVHHGDHQQRVPGHGPPVAGAVLRRAIQPGAPDVRHARLREAGGGVRVRRSACRASR